MDHIAVVGAGQAGATLCETLRRRGHAGRLTLWGDEPHPPYQRPPLSKGYLLGEMTRERLFLRPADFWDDLGVELHLGQRIDAIDPVARTLTHAGGTEGWDALALTTGAAPRRLPAAIGGDLAGVHTVRSLADIDALAPDLHADGRLLVVGGGYIGLEAAAVARKRGAGVVLVEAAQRLLSRVACAETAAWFAALHRDRGVDLRLGATLQRLEGDGRVERAVLGDGTVLDVDAVVVGIGVTPETGLAQAAGLTIDDGIAVDALGRSSADGIWAAGDCCSFPWGDGRLRLESVGNAIDMAEAVGANVMGAATPYAPKPWFWSDQYDVKLQIAGLGNGHDRVVVRRDGAGLSHWYYAGDRLLAVDAMNDPRAYMVGKRLIEAGRSADPAQVADPAVPPKALMA